eukprot:TRINITY_DN4698_c0_g1_i1.p1 TRINITY_DN4698_c0_g1~~TRINITY_DN4698_c0_g1_i1.p1  ORF type:complete len:272 (+),score=66.81 TRINITY_DN4698_c0_g1_i1:21-836(+)
MTKNVTEKKVKYLIQKATQVLSKSESKPIEEIVSSVPTSWIFLTGCGAGSSITYEQILPLFDGNSGFDRLHTYKAKPYAMASFHTEKDAEQFYEKYHAKHNETLNKVLILQYSKHSPLQSEAYSPELNGGAATFKYQDGLIPGLTIVTDFLTEKEEDDIINEINQFTWSRLSKRYVQHHGYQFRYETNDVDTKNPLIRMYTNQSVDSQPEEADTMTTDSSKSESSSSLPPQSHTSDGQFPPLIAENVVNRMSNRKLIEHIPDQLTINKVTS